MRVLYLASLASAGEGGYAEVPILRQAQELASSGVDIKVIGTVARFSRTGRHLRVTYHRKQAVAAREEESIAVRRVYYPNPPLSVAPELHIRLLTKALRPIIDEVSSTTGTGTVLHANGLFPLGTAAVRLGREKGVPVLVTALGSDVHTYPNRSRRIHALTAETLRDADHVAAVSRALAGDAMSLACSGREVTVLYRGVDLSRFSPGKSRASIRARLGLPAEGVGFCYVGRLIPEKGIPELVEAFRSLRCSLPGAWMSLVGDGPLLTELRLSQGPGEPAEGVMLPGHLSQEQLVDWLRASDIFVLPSHKEGLPNAIREAMAVGLPVIATAVGGVAEIVRPDVTGVLLAAEDVDGLASAMRELGDGPSVRERMGAEARRLAERDFTWGAAAQAASALYRSLLASQCSERGSAD